MDRKRASNRFDTKKQQRPITITIDNLSVEDIKKIQNDIKTSFKKVNCIF